jgi:hypothetical protein
VNGRSRSPGERGGDNGGGVRKAYTSLTKAYELLFVYLMTMFHHISNKSYYQYAHDLVTKSDVNTSRYPIFGYIYQLVNP